MTDLNSAFIEELYYSYLKDPDSVSPEWRDYFAKKQEKPPIHSKVEPVAKAPAAEQANTPVRQGDVPEPLLSISAKIAENMEASLELPTATSVRAIPVKVLDENRRIINKHLSNLKRKRVSFTHILAWAMVKGLKKFPTLNDYYAEIDGKPHRVRRSSVNIGLAVDLTKKDGTRLLLVPNIKNADEMNFESFVAKFNDLIDKARTNKLDLEDLQGTSVTLTNPGMIGTTHSSPRLMKGQGLIIATGSIDYPIEFQAVKPSQLTNLAISKVVTITSTYDHRIIQGAESAEFLAYINKLLLGKDQFYDQIFYSLDVPFEPLHWENDYVESSSHLNAFDDTVEKNAHIMLMINAYRVRGHLLASFNPLGRATYYYPELDPSHYGLNIWDLDRVFHADDNWENNNIDLRDIIELLRETYCGNIGYEFMHIQEPIKKDWIKSKLETNKNRTYLTNDDKINIFKKIVDAEFFENFLHTKFVGHKRFSLEGGESVIVMLDKIFENSTKSKLNTIVIGMAHRGRLNVLVNNIGKEPASVFNEFDGDYDPELDQAAGDVKYHLGAKGKYTGANNQSVDIILSPNPSHLELVDPVIVGMARAIDNKINDYTYSQALPIIIHGDAAFAGQGIVAETLNLSQLEGYKTGGTIHIIINNQIGFTTSSDSARSTYYATDIAKMIQTPILHVNGNDPEAIAAAADFASEYRQTFASDVIIDMLCYRKYGHNEGDEPTYTQPLLYKKIKMMTPVSKIYQEELIRDSVMTKKDIDDYYVEIKERFNASFSQRKILTGTKKFVYFFKEGRTLTPYFTAISENILKDIAKALSKAPDNFKVNPKLMGMLKKRYEMVFNDEVPIDWALGESLALGSILAEARDIRFTGQDSRRGTFSHRHSVLTDIETEDIYIPLNHIRKGQGILRIFDSPLSEMAVLGYEYGYSVIAENDLTVWEAQFGDFANNAQTVFDQYIACGEVKWGQTSNLVVLLPHSYDGQGSEHSSARLERYLQLCAEENMIVANFTTPANYFHALRRQMFMTHKIPLIIMTPKSMLRNALAVSPLSDFYHGEFKHIIDDETIENKEAIDRIILCSGKIYYELLEKRDKADIGNISLVRIEQIYPLHEELLDSIVESYPNAKDISWVQEEPQNMGAYSHLFPYLLKYTEQGTKLNYYGRKASAATAPGSNRRHIIEQEQILNEALMIR